MAVDFRCEKCGKLLNVDAEPGSKVRCPHCNKKLRVPAALATLPTPQVPGRAIQPGGQTAAPPPEGEEDEILDEGPDPVMALMAALMPWVLSVFFHLGLALIMLFFVLIAHGAKKKELDVSSAATNLKDTSMSVSRSTRSLSKRATAAREKSNYSDNESNIPSDSGKIKEQVTLGRGSASGNPDAVFGGGGAGGGPVGSFYGKGFGSGARHVIYVIDRSGSMVTVFDYVRMEMQLSISDLSEAQDFHIVLFADEKTIEGPSNRLVKATEHNKLAVVDFLESDAVRPRGGTTALVALKRAFQVFDGASDKKGKILLLLTDGEFAGIGGGSRYKGASGNDAVLNWLADNNKDKDVTIKTYLYTHGTSEKAKQVMNKIARDHGGGRAKLINPND